MYHAGQCQVVVEFSVDKTPKLSSMRRGVPKVPRLLSSSWAFVSSSLTVRLFVRRNRPRRTLHGSFARAVRQPHPLLRKPAAGTFVHLAQCINVSLVIPIPLNATCVPDAPSKIGGSGSNMLKSTAPLRCSSMSLSAYSR